MKGEKGFIKTLKEMQKYGENCRKVKINVKKGPWNAKPCLINVKKKYLV